MILIQQGIICHIQLILMRAIIQGNYIQSLEDKMQQSINSVISKNN
jgi:hypothetical protein